MWGEYKHARLKKNNKRVLPQGPFGWVHRRRDAEREKSDTRGQYRRAPPGVARVTETESGGWGPGARDGVVLQGDRVSFSAMKRVLGVQVAVARQWERPEHP